ncbi:MAG: septum site-determining protein MinC [Pseudomonadota bacterium]|nr:septum site-determining protein MinC [Pseudomonadota bacterium]
MAHPATTTSAAAAARTTPLTLRTGPGGSLVLELAPGATFDTLRTALRTELGAVADKYAGTSARFDLGRREIDLFDLRRLVHLVKDEFGMDIVGVCCTSEAVQRHAERELKLKVHILAPVPEAPTVTKPVGAPAPEAPLAGHAEEGPTELVRGSSVEDDDEAEQAGAGRVLTIDGTVRSGAVVRFAGDIQVFGDVNPGAQLIAGGSVLVFGALKGLAHAGARGDIPASTGVGPVILAFDMRPTQLRIGKVIQLPANPPEQVARHVANQYAAPEIAWMSNGSIVIEPYRGRLPSPATKESS